MEVKMPKECPVCGAPRNRDEHGCIRYSAQITPDEAAEALLYFGKLTEVPTEDLCEHDARPQLTIKKLLLAAAGEKP